MTLTVAFKRLIYVVKGTILTFARLIKFGGGCKSGANDLLIHPVLSAKVTFIRETS